MNIENAKVVKVNPTVSVGSSGFQKRELWLLINTDTQYPDTIAVEAHKEKCAMFDTLKVDDVVTVDINLRGRIWDDTKNGTQKVFNTLNAWKVTVIKSAPVAVSDDDSPF